MMRRFVVAATLCGFGFTATAHAWVQAPAGAATLPGVIAYAADGQIWTMDGNGGHQHAVTHGPADGFPSISPDGTRIVFAHEDGNNGFRIWVMNVDGSDAHALTPPGTPGTDHFFRGNVMPRWSADGSRITFVSRVPTTDLEHANEQIWVMNADGSGLEQVTNFPWTDIAGLSWSPDGSRLLFEAQDITGMSSAFHFYVMTAAGGNVRQALFEPAGGLLCGIGAGVDWAPSRIAYGGCDRARLALVPELGETQDVASDKCVGEPTWPAADNDETMVCVGPQHELYFVNDPTNKYRLLSAQQLTFDSAWHSSPSWGPAPADLHVVDAPYVAAPQPLQPLQRTALAVIHCPAGHSSCADRLTLRIGGLLQRSLPYTVPAGASRAIHLRLSAPLRRALRLGAHPVLGLLSRSHGRTTTVQQSAQVLARAGFLFTCPAPKAPTQSGIGVPLHGTLLADGPRAAAGKAIRVLALSPEGTPASVTGTTDAAGRFVVTFVPGEPGVWTLQAHWAGDGRHPDTASPACGLDVLAPPAPPAPPVSPPASTSTTTTTPAPTTTTDTTTTPAPSPPPAATSLSLSCPQKIAFGSTLDVSGRLTPPFAGAQVTLTFTHAIKSGTEELTRTVTSASDGTFSDSTVAPDDTGEWDVRATYAGDADHAASTSQTCATPVS